MKYRLSREAARDIDALYDQGIDRFGSAQAKRYLGDLKSALRRLTRFPDLAPRRFASDPVVRVARFRSHIIFYIVDAEGIFVIRVRHGSEDWQAEED